MKQLRVMGIDPGNRTGYCIWDGEKIHKITTTSKDKMFDVLKEIKEEGLVNLVAIEVSTNTHIYKRPDTSEAAMRRIACNVGMNKAEALRLVGLVTGLGFEVVEVEPYKTKMNEQMFKKITRWEGRTSSHARDAYGIARRGYAENYFKLRIAQESNNE